VTGPLLVAVATTFFTIIVHALVLDMIIEAVRRYVLGGRAGVFLRDLTLVMSAAIVRSLRRVFKFRQRTLLFGGRLYDSGGLHDSDIGPMEAFGAPGSRRRNAHVWRHDRYDLCCDSPIDSNKSPRGTRPANLRPIEAVR
jgi:hypothetical protein